MILGPHSCPDHTECVSHPLPCEDAVGIFLVLSQDTLKALPIALQQISLQKLLLHFSYILQGTPGETGRAGHPGSNGAIGLPGKSGGKGPRGEQGSRVMFTCKIK